MVAPRGRVGVIRLSGMIARSEGGCPAQRASRGRPAAFTSTETESVAGGCLLGESIFRGLAMAGLDVGAHGRDRGDKDGYVVGEADPGEDVGNGVKRQDEVGERREKHAAN